MTAALSVREHIRAVLHGQNSDRVPFVPYQNLVPRGDFERELRNRGMGLLVHSRPVRATVNGVRVEEHRNGSMLSIAFHTPVGSVYSKRETQAGRLVDGGTLEVEWPIKTAADFEPVIFMIENTTYSAESSQYTSAVRDLGGDGIVVVSGPCSPYESAYWESSGAYFSLEDFVGMQVDHPALFARLLDALQQRLERQIPLAIESPGEVTSLGWLGGVFGPRQFRDHVLPFYREYVPRFEQAGKICSLHADATNLTAFADLVAETGIHVVEAFTPPPVGDLSLSDARRAWGRGVVIWVNLPETIFLLGRQKTYHYVRDLLEQDGESGRLVLGMTEMGHYGVTDDETELLFKEGMRSVMDAIDGGYS